MKKIYWILLVGFSLGVFGTQDDEVGVIYDKDETYSYLFDKTKCCVNLKIDNDPKHHPVKSVRCLGEKVDYQVYLDWKFQHRMYVPFMLEINAIDKYIFRYYNSKLDSQQDLEPVEKEGIFLGSAMTRDEVAVLFNKMVYADRLYACPESRRVSIREDWIDKVFPFFSIDVRESLRRRFMSDQIKRFEPYTGEYLDE